MSQGVHFAWGDGDVVRECVVQSIRDFETSVDHAAADSYEGLAALRSCLSDAYLLEVDPSALRSSARALQSEMAQRLLILGRKASDQSERVGFLVQGLSLRTDFSGNWKAEFPEHEVNQGFTQWGDGWLVLSLMSAFRQFVSLGDYYAAEQVAQLCPEAFTTPGLRGWRAATQGFLRADEAVERFAEAADQFAQDVFDEERAHHGWSGFNVFLWTKYFRARAAVAEILRTPDRVTELVQRASSALRGTESGLVNPQVNCFRVLVNALVNVLSGDPKASGERGRAQLLSLAQVFGLDENDRLTLEFLETADAAFAEIHNDPHRALVSGRLAAALAILGRIPLLGGDFAAAISPAIGGRALAELLGPQRTWIYRTIESIRDEEVLSHLLLRLMQGGLPRYAQVRHGPIEYGKDIVALVEGELGPTLQMYQTKVGDITKSNWPKARDELEEMFQVTLDDIQLPLEPQSREGVLVFNGHLNPYVEPVVAGWRAEQKHDHGRTFHIMHLDEIVTWIVTGGLINELRAALEELGVPVVEQAQPSLGRPV